MIKKWGNLAIERKNSRIFGNIFCCKYNGISRIRHAFGNILRYAVFFLCIIKSLFTQNPYFSVNAKKCKVLVKGDGLFLYGAEYESYS